MTKAPAPCRISEHRQVRWPQASEEKEWLQFGIDVDSIMEATAKGEADRRLQSMTTIIVSLAAEGEEKKAAKTYSLSNRATKILQLRKELKSLKQQYKEASEEGRDALSELCRILHKKLTTLTRAKWHRRRKKERVRKRTAFLANPLGFTKQLLGQLTSPKSEIDSYLRDTISDATREQDLGQSKSLINPPAPTLDFKGKDPTLPEIQEVVKICRLTQWLQWE